MITSDGISRQEEKILTVDVKPGWKAGTKITFPREGDQIPGKIPADIVFVIRDTPHPLFVRDGVDLRLGEYILSLSLRGGESKSGKKIKGGKGVGNEGERRGRGWK